MNPIEQQGDTSAILQVIADESSAFWNKDFAAWAKCWGHTANIRMMGWWAHGGITVIEGWEALSHRVLTVKTLDLKAFKTAKYLPKTGNETLSYVSVDLQVGINAELPDEIALGQLVSLGYGTLRRLRKPGPNDG